MFSFFLLASCLPCLALSSPPDSIVLDACAAPDDKTICLANYLQNHDILHTIEINKRRFKELNTNLTSAYATYAHTLNDFVLLDPSYFGSDIRNRNDEAEIIDKQRLECQIRMITYVLTKFSKVQRVSYSKCSIHRQDNEQVVETILDQFSDTFQLVDFLPQRENRGQTERTRACLRALPDDKLTNGFFVACFERIIKIDT